MYCFYYCTDFTMGGSCDNTYDTIAQTLNSPNYPNDYGNQDCTWTLVAPTGKRLKLDSFQYAFDRYGYGCLEIADESTRIAKLCKNGNQHDIMSTENVLYLKLTSGYSHTSSGFQVHYEIIGNLHYYICCL